MLYNCKVCNARFKTVTQLKRHTLIHSAKETFLCRICMQSFDSQEQLKTHLGFVHTFDFPISLSEGLKDRNNEASMVTIHV